MIKQLIFGFYICGITLGAAYGTMLWKTQSQQAAENQEAEAPPLEQVQTKRISVPIIGDGVVKGYVLAQFIFRIDAKASHELNVRPDIFLVDEAIKVIFSGEAVDFSNLQQPDASALSKVIKKNVNARFGESFVQEVLVQELNYVPQERFRGGALEAEVRYG